MASNEHSIKRGPGRPPKKRPPPRVDKYGIAENPDSPHHRLEFVYEDPMMFKSLFTYFKNLKARDIHIRCTPAGITFFTRDQSRISRIVAHIPGKEVNHYYCDDTFWLGMNRDKIEKLFSSIDKSFYKITILYRYDEEEFLTFVFRDHEIDKECNYKITVSLPEEDAELIEVEKNATDGAIQKFPIEWELSSKQFKKTFNDASNYADTITVEKLGETPLQLTYSHRDIVYYEVYRSTPKIKLRSTIEKNQTFRCTVKVANVKCLAAAMVTETVRIMCREDDDILFRSEIDALVMSTFTSLV